MAGMASLGKMFTILSSRAVDFSGSSFSCDRGWGVGVGVNTRGVGEGVAEASDGVAGVAEASDGGACVGASVGVVPGVDA